MVASRLNSLAQAKDFKNFLKNPPLEEMEEEEEELAQQEENNMTEADIDLMFMERV
jgi:hypothetical protein